LLQKKSFFIILKNSIVALKKITSSRKKKYHYEKKKFSRKINYNDLLLQKINKESGKKEKGNCRGGATLI
jgi:hypothetical protein